MSTSSKTLNTFAKAALAAFVCFALAAAGARSAFASLNDTETRLNTFSVAQPQAFAVYCATDESLDFYKRSEIPNTGATFEGKTATRIFANVETTSASAVPWKSIAANVRTIAIVDEIRPTSTAQWFAGFNACESLDFSHLDTTHTNSMTAMISECLRVSNIVLGSKFSCTGSGSVSDFAFPQGEGIPYATGAWIAESNKTAYAATNIPSNKADTYRLQYGIEGSIALTGEAAVGETIIAALSDTSEKALTRMTWYRIDPQGIRTEINASLVRVIEEDSRGNHLKTAYTAQPEDAGCTLLCTAFDASGVYVGTIESAPTKTMAKPLEAYAVFSNQDGSLEFFNDRNKPAPGETSRTGKVVTEVYEGFVNKSYDALAAPWKITQGNNIKSVSFIDTVATTKCAYWFASLTNCTSFTLANFDTSQCTTFDNAFAFCKSLESIDLDSLDMSSGTSFQGMFSNCTSLRTVKANNIDTSSAKMFNGFFSRCSSLETIDVSAFDTQNLEMAAAFFLECTNLRTITGLEQWNLQSNTTLYNFFSKCSNLTRIKGIEHWNTSHIKEFNQMFYGCTSLISLDLSNWSVSSGTNFSSMFSGASSLTSIGDVSRWSFDAATGDAFGYMFYNCSALRVDCSQWKVRAVFPNIGRVNFMTNAPGVIPPVNWS